MMQNNYTQEDIFNNLDTIQNEYPKDGFRTIWEIYCHQYDVDYDDNNTVHTKSFDIWVEQKKIAWIEEQKRLNS